VKEINGAAFYEWLSRLGFFRVERGSMGAKSGMAQ